ncbi:MAG: hypothetical protein ACM3UW_07890 [Bacillota bacterium]
MFWSMGKKKLFHRPDPCTCLRSVRYQAYGTIKWSEEHTGAGLSRTNNNGRQTYP